MSAPLQLVDELFGRLTLRYGAAFLEQWRGGTIGAIKTDWSHVLSGLDQCPAAIAYALDNLPERPVNAMAFRALCRQYSPPPEKLPALPAPPSNPEVVKAVQEAAAAIKRAPRQGILSPAQQAIDGIVAGAEERGRLSAGQRGFLERCVTALPADDSRRQKLANLGFAGGAA